MQPFLGQIQLFPYKAPRGWIACAGQMMSVPQNQELFALLGTAYGGNGVVTFGLPNLVGKEPAPGLHYCIALVADVPAFD